MIGIHTRRLVSERISYIFCQLHANTFSSYNYAGNISPADYSEMKNRDYSLGFRFSIIIQ